MVAVMVREVVIDQGAICPCVTFDPGVLIVIRYIVIDDVSGPLVDPDPRSGTLITFSVAEGGVAADLVAS
jgi:hypothetical protein